MGATIDRRSFLAGAALSALIFGDPVGLTRRLLASSGGGGSFVLPEPEPVVPTVVTLSTAPQGGWTVVQHPKAVQHGGKVFLNWVNATNGEVEYAEWDEAAETLSTPVALGTGLADEGATDNHNSGAILRRSSDGKLVAAYSGHLDTRVRVRVSTNADDATAWGSETVLDPGYGGVYTYAGIHELSGTIYLLLRSIPNLGSQVGRIVYATSSDGGATWSSFTVLMSGSTSPARIPYWQTVSNGSRIDVLTTDRSPSVADASSLYHFYFDGTHAYQTDGTQISDSWPFAPTDATLVSASSASHPRMAWGASYQGDGKPAGVYMVSEGGTDCTIYSARWSGSAWSSVAVTTAGGILTPNVFASGAAIDHANANTIYASRKVGSWFELYRYTTTNGTTWTETQITSGSSAHNVWADTVTTPGTLKVVWLHGTYSGDTNYSFGIRGAGVA